MVGDSLDASVTEPWLSDSRAVTAFSSIGETAIFNHGTHEDFSTLTFV